MYFAGLELGPASVQAIARKSGITRPTMYEILKILEGKGAIQVFKRKEGMLVLEEQLLFTLSKTVVVFSSEWSLIEKKRRKAIYEKIRKRLGKFTVQEKQTLHLGGTLYLLDKVIFISHKKQEGYLVDNPLVVDSLKCLF